jgi:DNA modification methylase
VQHPRPTENHQSDSEDLQKIVVGEVKIDRAEGELPAGVNALLRADHQTALPAIARSETISSAVLEVTRRLRTQHRLYLGDARDLSMIDDESVHLIVTSPPYWTLKEYPDRDGQLGAVEDYEAFLGELDKVWTHCFRVLAPGGRMVVVVGDVNVARRRFGRHLVFPLHASIQEHCRSLGFDNLAPILWYKIANAKFEAGGSGYLGKPFEPNGVIKNDIEFILFQRKAGGYRSPSLTTRALSVIPATLNRHWFQQIWTITGASTRKHPAPFPLELAERLVRMFSFAGDVVLDPFMGTGTTNLAAANWGRDSIGVELEPSYQQMSVQRLVESHQQLKLMT